MVHENIKFLGGWFQTFQMFRSTASCLLRVLIKVHIPIKRSKLRDKDEKSEFRKTINSDLEKNWHCKIVGTQWKIEKYDASCKKASWHFVTMAFGTWGGMGPEGHKTLKRMIAQAAGAWEGERKGAGTDFLRQRVATALMSSIIPILLRRLQVQTHQ